MSIVAVVIITIMIICSSTPKKKSKRKKTEQFFLAQMQLPPQSFQPIFYAVRCSEPFEPKLFHNIQPRNSLAKTFNRKENNRHEEESHLEMMVSREILS